MTIVDRLKELIKALGGDASGIMTISQALKVLNPLLEALQGE